jgi:hypothetical protein
VVIALMVEAARTSKTSVNFYEITRRNNPEDNHLHPHCHEKPQILLKNEFVFSVFCIKSGK